MKIRVLAPALVMLALLIAGCNPIGDLLVGDYAVFRTDPNPNQPDWLSDGRLVSAAGSTDTVFEFSLGGQVVKEHSFTVAGAENTYHIAASPDGSQVAFCIAQADSDARDVVVMDLATDTVTNLTEGAGNYHGVSYLNANEIVYIDYDYSVSEQLTNRLIRHNISTDATTAIIERTMPTDGTAPLGDNFWLSTASPNGTKVLVGAQDYDREEISFQVLDADTGAVLFDGFQFGVYDDYRAGDFITDDKIIILVRSGESNSYLVIDISTPDGALELGIPLVDERITDVYGANVSPDKTLVASHFAQIEDGDFVRNWLLIARIAAPVE